MRAYSTVQQLLCHGSYCELFLSLARTSCRLLFTVRPPAPSYRSHLRLATEATRNRNAFSPFYARVVFSFFFFYKFNRHLCHGDIRVALLICLFCSSFGIFFFVINGYVYVNLYTHFPSLPYSCSFIAIFICIYASTILYRPLISYTLQL